MTMTMTINDNDKADVCLFMKSSPQRAIEAKRQSNFQGCTFLGRGPRYNASFEDLLLSSPAWSTCFEVVPLDLISCSHLCSRLGFGLHLAFSIFNRDHIMHRNCVLSRKEK